MSHDVLDLFHPAVARWFDETYASPTPAQALGWPRIAAGENTLILAPTGSGKTLAAFLYAIDETIRTKHEQDVAGVRTLYLSPLKALANDIERNLARPLLGIQRSAETLNLRLPAVRVGVRTGDTPPGERQRMVRTPPDLLMTTPESLHLLLTSSRAREMLRTVRFVIVDEIHAVCSDKRGVFLSLLLERLESLTGVSPVRIGLSATQRPLSTVAGFLGGSGLDGESRAVSIVDAGARPALDLTIECPVEDMTALPAEPGRAPSVWPAIIDRLIEHVDEHTSTLIFANSRRVVERIAAEMNERIGCDLVQAHHGSVSKERRQQIEGDLKAGRLPAMVATSSMELGIDIGAIDLVCQVESPFSVASGLQRIGRAGHLVRATSKGRMIPKTRADLLLCAAMSRAMLRGEISDVSVPHCPLDVLAQQVVAMVAVEPWDVDGMWQRIRCAFPYRDLSRESFLSVLELVSGGYRTAELPALRPRVSWDRAANQLVALPGARHAAILNGGVIPDTGQYPMVLDDGHTRLGELDEEFVFERRVGDTFVLGTGQWRIARIAHDRVVVTPSEDAEAMMPFWKGEGLGHDAAFGERMGSFVRSCETRLDDPALTAELQETCALDARDAAQLMDYLKDQKVRGGLLPTDRRIVLDVFRNETGGERMSIVSTFGRAFHLSLLLLLEGTLRQRGVSRPEAVFSNHGILLRLGTVSEQALSDAVASFRADTARDVIAEQLQHSPAFALHFRRNAGRALLLPRARPGRRTPLWLQRLRAHDLLAFASRHKGFPIVLETYRELLDDVLPIGALLDFLRRVETGDAGFEVCKQRHPTPFSRALLLDFTANYLYEEDRPVPSSESFADVREALETLSASMRTSREPLDTDAARTVEERLQGVAPQHRARNGAELIELLRTVGDLTPAELATRCETAALDAVPELGQDGRLRKVEVSAAAHWVVAEDASRYARWSEEDALFILDRYVSHRAVSTVAELMARYPVSAAKLNRICQRAGWVETTRSDGTTGWSSADVLPVIQRLTMSRRRRSVEPVTAEAYASFLLHQHHLDAPVSLAEMDGILRQLSGCRLPVAVWRDVLSFRIRGFDMMLLDARVRDGTALWTAGASAGGRWLTLCSELDDLASTDRRAETDLSDAERHVVSFLRGEGASFLHRIASGLGERPSTIALLLWDLMWQGWVTNDSLSPALHGKPRPERWGATRRPPWGGGRWSLVAAVASPTEPQVRGRLGKMLGRHGVLTREVLALEGASLDWRMCYPMLTRMEWAGDVERARYVSGLSGPQFASRSAARMLRSPNGTDGPILVNVNDPANPYGRLFPVLRDDGSKHIIRHHPGNYLVVARGIPILAIERRGERLTPLADLSADQRRSALALLLRLVQGRDRPASIRVKTWAGGAVPDVVAAELAECGFASDGTGMVLYRSFHERKE